jgi:hypothetical protein
MLDKIIKEKDIVECVTADGWESGTVIKISDDVITVFMDYVQREMEFTIDRIR